MADKTPDLSHKDILSVVVRFVNDEGKPEERLLEVCGIVDKTGQCMVNEILETCANPTVFNRECTPLGRHEYF